MRTTMTLILLTLSAIAEAQDVYIPSLDMTVDMEVLQFKAEDNEPLAMFMLGLCYEEGEGIPHTSEMAFHWYRESAKQKYPEGMKRTAECYLSGYGTERNDARAYAWMLRAARAGDTQAMFGVGMMYQDGWCAPTVDVDKALYWYQKAAEQGCVTAQIEADAIIQKRKANQ